MKHFLYLTLALFTITGCHQSSSEPAAAPNKAKEELAGKLKTMSPDERRAYILQHPDEVQKALPGFGVAPRK